MKRLAFRLTVALLAFITGLFVVALLASRQRLSAQDKTGTGKIERATISPSETETAEAEESSDDEGEKEPLDAVFIKGDKLSYAGYEVERAFDASTQDSTATISKNGETLLMLNGGSMGKDSTKIGLFPFLGGKTKQLVILQYTGGAHCCWVYRIYELTPKLRAVFDGDEHGIDSIGYELSPEDIDGDGRYEFTQAVMTFDYFHMSHASSVFPRAVFAYDEKERKYLPANRKYPDYLLKGLADDLKRVEAEREEIRSSEPVMNERYLAAVMQVLLKYVYAGREMEGWEFYEREYQLSNKAEIRADIKKELKSDPVYLSIYRAPSR